MRLRHSLSVTLCAEFQFTHPGKGATDDLRTFTSLSIVSIHAPWEGCDMIVAVRRYPPRQGFNSRTLGRVRLDVSYDLTISVRVSIHAPWEGCDPEGVGNTARLPSVSIHAPWEGCDIRQLRQQIANINVSIHAPWEGCDTGAVSLFAGENEFQFTHPGKGATHPLLVGVHLCTFQFTHPGKGATSQSTRL